MTLHAIVFDFQQPTEEVRKRYEDAVSFLKLVATNKAHLQIQNVETSQDRE